MVQGRSFVWFSCVSFWNVHIYLLHMQRMHLKYILDVTPWYFCIYIPPPKKTNSVTPRVILAQVTKLQKKSPPKSPQQKSENRPIFAAPTNLPEPPPVSPRRMPTIHRRRPHLRPQIHQCRQLRPLRRLPNTWQRRRCLWCLWRCLGEVWNGWTGGRLNC